MSLQGEKVLVTGGAGFIPSHIVEKCLAAGATVTVADNYSAGKRSNLAGVEPWVRILDMDIRDESIVSVIRQQDVVFHMAGNADVPVSVRDPEFDFSNNVIGSYNVLRACLKSDLRRVVFASSAAVYGEPEYVPMDENHPLRPRSPYGAAKLAVEKLGVAYFQSFGLPFTAVRIFNTYGERQPRYVMFDLLQKLYSDPTRLEVLGTGNQVRDYCYVTDAASCFVAVAGAEDANGQVYNLAGGNPVSIKDLVRLLIGALGLADVQVSFTGESWAGDIEVLIGDTAKATAELRFVPTVMLSEGIRLLDNYLRSSKEPKS